MGNDPNVFVNNNIYNGNIEETLNKVIERMEIEVFIRYDENDELNIKKKENTYIVDIVDYNDSYTVKTYFEKHGNICLEKVEYISENNSNKIDQNEKYGKIKDIYISKNCVYYSDNLFFPGRWSGFKDYLDNSISNDLINYCNEKFEMFINFSKKIFESNELIIFMDCNNEDIWDKLISGASFNEILYDDRWNILYEIPIKKAINDNYLIYKKI